jgi:hypothetical protein
LGEVLYGAVVYGRSVSANSHLAVDRRRSSLRISPLVQWWGGANFAGAQFGSSF